MDALPQASTSNWELQAKPQSLPYLPPYLTEGDWQQMEQMHKLDCMRIICERLRKLGMATLLHVITSVHKSPMPTAHAIYDMVKDLAEVFSFTVPCKTNLNGLKVYPVSPAHLPPNLLKAAYGEEKPSMVDLSLAAYYPRIALRNTSSLLAADSAKEKEPSQAKQAELNAKLDSFLNKWGERESAGQVNGHPQTQWSVSQPMKLHMHWPSPKQRMASEHCSLTTWGEK